MFEGESLARTASQEHAAQQLSRTRSGSAGSRAPGFSAVIPSISRPAPIAETASTHSTVTLADEEAALETGHSEKGVKEVAPPSQEVDEFLVTLKGREHLNPHTWRVNYRWFLTAFAGLLVLNASEFPLFSRLMLPSASQLADVLLSAFISPFPSPSRLSMSLSIVQIIPRLSSSAFASSAPSNLIGPIISEFNVGQEVGTLLISIFVAGYCVGPLRECGLQSLGCLECRKVSSNERRS